MRGQVPYINEDSGVKFNGKIKRTYPRVFINSLKNKVRFISTFEAIKYIIRQNLQDNALIWFLSQ